MFLIRLEGIFDFELRFVFRLLSSLFKVFDFKFVRLLSWIVEQKKEGIPCLSQPKYLTAESDSSFILKILCE